MIELKLQMQSTGKWRVSDGLGNYTNAYTKDLPGAVKRMVNGVADQINKLVVTEATDLERQVDEAHDA